MCRTCQSAHICEEDTYFQTLVYEVKVCHFGKKKKKERKHWAIIHIFIHMQHILFVNPKCASGVSYSNFSSMVKNALLLLQDLASKFRGK